MHKSIGRSVQHIQAVDFVARTRGDAYPAIVFLEFKDYRTPGVAFPRHGDLATEVAAKVAGTLVGLLAASRKNEVGFRWDLAAKRIGNNERGFTVFLHVENSAWMNAQDAKTEMATLAQIIEKKLAWLAACRVVVLGELAPRVQDCTVTTRP